ncbi:MAG: bifunctional phosphopantothenoylcysteine decarboxylase/phosphopantothenate--cysteine ligase CoaBC [Bacteroidales bacterium]|jgi:phosphopantothenoylcysteine decarboxylase/phosphopantothenate--cysteine ligase|nr:bifunctional phosphopantothenoylcysteine decarboxylase/phosphopantothenate--cysteine ligase CoaBC [Bacteroidales bacterium]MDD3166410.1 bifunctional phosphopantothenoylcysteine decarboxylase/phosphopantothenate--cysteine ligase CoaBC [Bacteroidales bacterium]MDD4771520.1 bifunctional phosphopantothenoylcysteine decarboxylase/phosphopantothenate--cysteine ligase CoaBC [Bacteroidales bacterium]HKL92591.1 bifunctional phosphopantothenoylcysteine decarboxylase/phosphopantothenate--cysteine ligase
MWTGKNVLIGISGGIAAYKIPELVRLFTKAGASVKVVATRNALQFVSPLTLETLTTAKVYSDVFASVNDYSTEHIALAKWADVFLIAPATANVLGKFANGIADDALSTLYLAYTGKVYVAPAMNTHMYEHPAVQRNMQRLKEDGVSFLEPTEGMLACGDVGKGRMQDPPLIFDALSAALQVEKPWSGKRILITAGPTHERIDPVRYIGNDSTGKMGYALAEACAERGAHVLLVSGPVQLRMDHPLVQRLDVTSAAEMHQEAVRLFPEVDAAILCAAVADFTPERTYDQKMKRQGADLVVRLKPTQDIAAHLGSIKQPGQTLVGFALETHEEADHAREKLIRKNLDFIVLNSLNDAGAGFGYDTNKVSILTAEGYTFEHSLKSKKEVAEDILDTLHAYLCE